MEGEIEINVDLLDPVSTNKRKQIIFSVRDTGIGVSKENQKKIFDAFAQEDKSTSRKYGGTGLGLAISNKLLALMNSKLELESEVKKGSKFYFVIDTETENEEQIDSVQSFQKKNDSNLNQENIKLNLDNTAINENIKILVVEDNEANMYLIQSILTQIVPSAIIIRATNGKQAVEKFLIDKPNIIFMDIQMPEMDGNEATIEIRKLEKNSRIPIIALTANTQKKKLKLVSNQELMIMRVNLL
ncbi:MAG: response regulator [Leptospiraceae bacterium]|nr:response regulator [Leptospiraceae bacterium]